MRIQHNIAALNSYRNLKGNNDSVSKSLEKLSSGYRINRAGDDAAGLAISEKMRGQITGLSRAQSNAQDGISLVQTAEGALTEVHSMLNRMVELATQSSNGVYDDGVSRKSLQNELNQLRDEIDRISDATNFNGKNLLDGSLTEKTYVSMYKSNQSVAITGNFKASGNLKAAFGNNAPTMNIKFKEDANAAVAVVNANTGAIEVQLGSQEATTYDNETINKAINTGIDNAITGLGTLDTAAKKEKAAALEKLKDSFTGSVDIKKAGVKATDTNSATGVQTLPDTDTGNEPLSLQIGDTNASYNKMDVDVENLHVAALGLDKISVSTQDAAGEAIVAIKSAIDIVSANRGNLGAIQNRLDHTINNLSVTTENMTAAESRVRDVDMAQEMMAYTKNNILVQSSQAMLAQANQVPQGVLQLLQ